MGIHLTARRKCFILITACLLDTIPSSLASPQSSNKVWYNSLGGRSGPIGSWDRRYIHPRGNVGYDDPANNGGQMLTVSALGILLSASHMAMLQIVNGTYPAGQGEPLNVIISAQSDADVLARNSDQGGFLNYML